MQIILDVFPSWQRFRCNAVKMSECRSQIGITLLATALTLKRGIPPKFTFWFLFGSSIFLPKLFFLLFGKSIFPELLLERKLSHIKDDKPSRLWWNPLEWSSLMCHCYSCLQCVTLTIRTYASIILGETDYICMLSHLVLFICNVIFFPDWTVKPGEIIALHKFNFRYKTFDWDCSDAKIKRP